MSIKLTWHKAANVWCKVIGKRLDASGKRLVQAQHYFTSDRQKSEVMAKALKSEWMQLKRMWEHAHAQSLRVLDEPFPTEPHWYRPLGRKPESAEDRRAIETEVNAVTVDEFAYEHRDATLSDVAGFFVDDRRKREGVDFQASTNKTLETDLSGAMRFLPDGTIAATLKPADIDTARIAMMRDVNAGKLKRRSVANFGTALGMLLRWYWKSALFIGGRIDVGFDDVFAKFPKRKPAPPVHLPMKTLKTIFDEATQQRRLYLMLILNTGMQPTDIAALQAKAFNLDAGKVTWKRQKNERIAEPSDVEIVSHLWPETVAQVRKYIHKSGFAFRTKDGKPLAKVTENRNRNNAVAKSLIKLFTRLDRDGIVDVSAKNFRQTGGQFIYEIGGYELSRIWLGRAFEKVDRPYLAETYAKLNAASNEVRAKLHTAGVL